MNKLATLCYLQKNGRTLMICPHKKKVTEYNGKWNGLGGKVQNGETPEECAIREVYEESNLKVKKLQFAGILTFPKIFDDQDWYCVVYKSSDFSGKLIESDEGNLEWIKNEKVLEKNLWEGDHFFLPYLFSGKLFNGKFFYKKGTLLKHSISLME